MSTVTVHSFPNQTHIVEPDPDPESQLSTVVSATIDLSSDTCPDIQLSTAVPIDPVVVIFTPTESHLENLGKNFGRILCGFYFTIFILWAVLQHSHKDIANYLVAVGFGVVFFHCCCMSLKHYYNGPDDE